MWINLNSMLYINLYSFFKIPNISTAQMSIDPYRLLYNSSIDKFFLEDYTHKLIYLDKTENHNSYVESYLINDFYNYKSKLKPYYGNTISYLRSDALNAILYRYIYGYLGNINQFQTEDEKYVVLIYKLPFCGTNLVTSYSFIVCNKIDFEDGIVLIKSSRYASRYITTNLHSNSEKLIFMNSSVSASYTDTIIPRYDLDSADVSYGSKNFFYIKTNPASFTESSIGTRPENTLPVWSYHSDKKEYIFDTSKNKIPDDIPTTLKIYFDQWQVDLSFLESSYPRNYYMWSFEDDYSDKKRSIRYGFSIHNYSSLGASEFYKTGSGSILFVIEFSDELNGYKMFDINNPKAGYFLCYDVNCLKDHTSYRFKAFLDENIYVENVFNYYKNNDLILTFGSEVHNYFYDNALYNDSYVYCLSKIKKLSEIYNLQIPFIRF